MQYKIFPTGSTIINSERAIVHGFNIRATATAVVNVYDNIAATGDPVFKINVSTTESVSYDSFKGIPFNTGIFVEVASGTATGSIFFE